MLTVLTLFSAVVLTLMILVAVRPFTREHDLDPIGVAVGKQKQPRPRAPIRRNSAGR
jgi:hypothetical protein